MAIGYFDLYQLINQYSTIEYLHEGHNQSSIDNLQIAIPVPFKKECASQQQIGRRFLVLYFNIFNSALQFYNLKYKQNMIRALATKQLQFACIALKRAKVLVGQSRYHFSQQPKKQQPEQKQKNKLKGMPKIGFSKLPNQKDQLQYIQKLIRKKSKRNPYLMNRLSYLKRILDSLPQSSLGSFFSQKQIVSFFFRNFFKFLIVTVAMLFYFQRRSKQEPFIDNPKTEPITTQAEINEFFDQFIGIIKKIKITSETFEDSQPDSLETEGKRIQSRKAVQYLIQIETKYGEKYKVFPYKGDPNKLLKYVEDMQKKHQITQKIDIFYENSQAYNLYDAFKGALGFLTPLIPILITLYIFRKSDPTAIMKNFSKGAKQFKIQALKDIKTRFKDVAGMEQAKKQITQFVDFLKYNQKYKQMGAKIPKGALLTGPPGTGKTMLARACAGQAGVSFFYISGSEFVEVFVGLGASKVRQLFAKARQNAPSIIFIDQIDAIGRKRQNSRNQQKDTTLNQLLVEMDGFMNNETIIVLAATNRKQILDNALTRPGRFDRMVQINLPDIKARQQIFMVHLSPLKINPEVQMKTIAKRLSELTPGFSGADIGNLCNQAAIIATRKNRQHIEDKDFEQATQRITAGYVKKKLVKQKTKNRVAYHEAGHAVASWFLKGGDPLVKLTIIPRSKGSLGYAQYLPKTSYIMARNQLIDKVAIMLGGITSEEVFFGQISSGGSDDLQKVYSLTRRMVTQFGMGLDTYNITLDQESYIQKQSTYLTNKMQDQISKILNEAKQRSRKIIEEKKDVIEALAKELLEKETLNNDEILKIMGERPNFDELKKSQALV